jgi:glutamyl-tRNA synthetase
MIRTALFNWAFARHHGGDFVFRIEDTDSARDSEQSAQALIDALRWLGLNWDEGPEVGGPYAPYRQSERLAIYEEIASKLRESGHAYDCYLTTDEIASRRKRHEVNGVAPSELVFERDLSDEQRAKYLAEGRQPVLRLKVPNVEYRWNDLVRGEISVSGENVGDYVLVRANGEPLYTLVNPVDDALMKITHVLRGEDLLSSTPRQLALYQELGEIGVTDGSIPKFGHLPYVMGEKNKKLSKRDPEASFSMYQKMGFLPEGLLNYLALLGWSPGNDVEFFSLADMARDFDISRVNASPARFDLKKAIALNADWVRAVKPQELANRIKPYLVEAGVLPADPTPEQLQILASATPLVSERMEVLSQAAGMLGFLFAGKNLIIEEDAAKILAEPDAAVVRAAAVSVLESCEPWLTPSIKDVLQKRLVDEMGLKPREAFGVLRAAITGRKVSPPLFESMELLGRTQTLSRLR